MLSPCIIYTETGHYCPGCGGLRAVYDLLHGAPVRAWHNNALVALGLPAALLGTLKPPGRHSRQLGCHARGPSALVVGITVLVVITLYSLLRNSTLGAGLRPT
ncbi:DUF2752 domain-containing protein [Serinicoccus sediminis]|uniref:DUF2752 domain-containing protein n=1 Tax=Serinicoccus sediminis TaxID=2306021 RepID=UPI003B510B4F